MTTSSYGKLLLLWESRRFWVAFALATIDLIIVNYLGVACCDPDHFCLTPFGKFFSATRTKNVNFKEMLHFCSRHKSQFPRWLHKQRNRSADWQCARLYYDGLPRAVPAWGLTSFTFYDDVVQVGDICIPSG